MAGDSDALDANEVYLAERFNRTLDSVIVAALKFKPAPGLGIHAHHSDCVGGKPFLNRMAGNLNPNRKRTLNIISRGIMNSEHTGLGWEFFSSSPFFKQQFFLSLKSKRKSTKIGYFLCHLMNYFEHIIDLFCRECYHLFTGLFHHLEMSKPDRQDK